MADLNLSAEHLYRLGTHTYSGNAGPDSESIDGHRRRIEPWLSAIFQTEHLSLLLGSGFTNAIVNAAGGRPAGMESQTFDCDYAERVDAYARESAEACRRGAPNIEDQLRVAFQLLRGLEIIGKQDKVGEWRSAIANVLSHFLNSVLECERSVASANEHSAEVARRILVSFLTSFASRTPSRERLHIFTTNYDRFVEHGCDLGGLRVIDHFVGALTPVFRSSRIEVDYHYNPPGIRGEPRYLEGVIRLTKLHGSIDWKWEHNRLCRHAVPFGANKDHPDVVRDPVDTTMIYPNAAKDVETLDYPYADLFRDFSTSVCRPNSSIVCYGYGFGDDHINRVLRDMLTIPSTHLVIVSWDWASGRIQQFVEEFDRDGQISLLIGTHFADVGNLVAHYLPKPAVDPISMRQTALIERRGDTTANLTSTQQ